MINSPIPESVRKHEIPRCLTITSGSGGLPKLNVKANRSAAEIYLHGAHVTGFQKDGEPPLLFLSASSQFAAGKPIRGGVPIIYPWFGPLEGHAMHGFARVAEWDLIEATASKDGSVKLRFRLSESAALGPAGPPASVHFTVTVNDKLTMELHVTNPSTTEPLSFENCLHTYFAVGDITEVSITGLKGTTFLDKVENFARKVEFADALRINSETDRVYLDTTGTVEIHDARFRRKIRVEKSGSASTVVWNPWITKAKAMSDFGDDEFQKMVCVESGNVAQNKLTLAPSQAAVLKVVLSSEAI